MAFVRFLSLFVSLSVSLCLSCSLFLSLSLSLILSLFLSLYPCSLSLPLSLCVYVHVMAVLEGDVGKEACLGTTFLGTKFARFSAAATTYGSQAIRSAY